MGIIRVINHLISVVFLLCYSYQFFYIPVSLFFKKKKTQELIRPEKTAEYAVLICARNESLVIGDLIDSLNNQSYGKDKLTVFVMADNCSDDTADIARAKGAVVYERSNRLQVGKGYALQVLLGNIKRDYPKGFAAYFVFDADNVLEPNYIEEMDKTLCTGAQIVTGYRNSKNYGDNWISAGYALWFLRESRYLNYPRYLLGNSCAVSGTGFAFSRGIAEDIEDWPFHLLTEDIEFSVDRITKGYKIAFCRNAVLYDEQPTEFGQSVRQRLRWSKGYLQVVIKYGKELIVRSLRGSFSCYDMAMSIMPAFILSLISVVCNLSMAVISAYACSDLFVVLSSIAQLLTGMYLTLFILGAITTVSEWKMIYTSTFKKLLYMFTFPLFMSTYIPISIGAVFWKGNWKPIHHTRRISIDKTTTII